MSRQSSGPCTPGAHFRLASTNPPRPCTFSFTGNPRPQLEPRPKICADGSRSPRQRQQCVPPLALGGPRTLSSLPIKIAQVRMRFKNRLSNSRSGGPHNGLPFFRMHSSFHHFQQNLSRRVAAAIEPVPADSQPAAHRTALPSLHQSPACMTLVEVFPHPFYFSPESGPAHHLFTQSSLRPPSLACFCHLPSCITRQSPPSLWRFKASPKTFGSPTGGFSALSQRCKQKLFM